MTDTSNTKFYITTPIYYVNGSPHIGHVYTGVATDVMARWQRLDGKDVFFLTGTDEYGQKVEKAAADAGKTPLQFTNEVSAQFRDIARLFNLSNDDFIRTTEERHHRACTELWNRLLAAGMIYEGAYEGWYAVRDEAYYTENELTLRPDGERVAPTGAPVAWVREPSFFFKLSAWQDQLLELYARNPDFIAPAARRNEVISFVKGGLSDLSISRTSFSWGVPVPDAPGHVMYVWLDALTNYLTATGWPDENAPRAHYWPADLHVIGKEISRFHAVYWPALLMAAGLPAPKRVYSHGWWTIEGEKMSKSLGNVVDPAMLVRDFGLDPVRFFLMREVPFGGDGNFSQAGLIARMNGELANDLGNLAQRSLSLIARMGGVQPPVGPATAEDIAMRASASGLPDRMRPLMLRQAFGDALEEAWKVVRAANAYIDHQAPWALRKTDPDRMLAVLRVLADTLRVLGTVLQPYMPDSMGKLLDQLAVPDDARILAGLNDAVADGVALPTPSGIFPRYVEEV